MKCKYTMYDSEDESKGWTVVVDNNGKTARITINGKAILATSAAESELLRAIIHMETSIGELVKNKILQEVQ